MQLSIQNYLPHTTPMLMVDIILTICQQEVKTHFFISEKNIFLQDHYLSEIGLIENAAQTCSAISGQYYFDENDIENCAQNPTLLGYIFTLKKVKIYQLPKVNTIITTHAQLISHTQNESYSICILKVVVFHQDTLFLEGEMNLFLENKAYEKE